MSTSANDHATLQMVKIAVVERFGQALVLLELKVKSVYTANEKQGNNVRDDAAKWSRGSKNPVIYWRGDSIIHVHNQTLIPWITMLLRFLKPEIEHV